MTDGQLLIHHLAGDEAAFAALFARHRGLVHAAARRQLGPGPEADDVTQAVFVALVRRARPLSRRPAVGGWLLRATRYAAIDAMRKGNRRRRHEAAAARPESVRDAVDDETWRRLSIVLDAAMNRLRPGDRELLVLRYFQNHSTADTARRLGLTEAAAQKRTVRALGRLRDHVRRSGLTLPAAAVAALVAARADAGAAAGPALTAVSVLTPPAGVASIAAGLLALMRSALMKSALSSAAVTLIVGGVLAGTSAVLLSDGPKSAATGPAGSSPTTSRPAAVAGGPAATQPTGAIAAVISAAALIKTDGPSNSPLTDYGGPIDFTPEWHAYAKRAWAENAPARAAVRQSRFMDPGRWPAWLGRGQDHEPLLPSLNHVRQVTNELGDAAFYALKQGRQNEALDFIDDLGHLVALLKGEPEPDGGVVRLLVGVGVDAVRAQRLQAIAVQLDLSPKAADPVPPRRIYGLIDALVSHPSAQATVDGLGEVRRYHEAVTRDTNRAGPSAAEAFKDAVFFEDWALSRSGAVRGLNRVYADRAMTAATLACHLYRQETGRWPPSLDALVPHYLATVPLDPGTNPPTPIGYRVVPGGLPDGNDRPLVFSRSEADSELKFATTQPLYEYYVGTGDNWDAPQAERRKKSGQFRDVARWPTTRPAGLVPSPGTPGEG